MDDDDEDDDYELLEPIHRAAFDGDLREVNELVEEDGRQLNAQIQGELVLDGWWFDGCSPLMLASYKGHDAVVQRLLALGADVGLRDTADGDSAAHWACRGEQPATLALLLDAGVSFNARSTHGWTPLIAAAEHSAPECVTLLLARGGEQLKLDAMDTDGCTALYHAYVPEVMQLLLNAGANPTIHNRSGRTPLDDARLFGRQSCIPLLKAAMAEPQRPRSLLKARTLLDTAHKIRQIRLGNVDNDDDEGKEQPRRSKRLAPKRKALAAAPAYLKGRVAEGRALPAVAVVEEHGQNNEELVACLKYALGLEGGGGVHEGEGPPPQGMLKEVFIEL